jgi:hypothetical protein
LKIRGTDFGLIQIRRGDSFDTGRLVAPLEDYVNATKFMCERYGISTVYVSSDSESAVKEFEAAITGLKVLKWNVDRQFLESNTQKCGATEFQTRGTGLGIEVILKPNYKEIPMHALGPGWE